MLGLRKIIGTILLVVIFLVLASLATFIYNSDQEKKEKVINNELVQEGKSVFQSLFAVSGNLADTNLQKNIGPAKVVVEKVSQSAEATGLWVKFKELVREEWNNAKEEGKQQEETMPTEETDDQNKISVPTSVDYKKTDQGAEIIFTSKNGEEYKLPLPFKFLNKS
jgi:hypothetical protein